MTIICAAKGPDGVWIGSDTQSHIGSLKLPVQHKWVVRNGTALGLSGFAQTQDMVIANPSMLDGTPWEIGRAIRTALEANGWKPKVKEGEPPDYDLHGILVRGLDFFLIGSDCNPSPKPMDFLSGGSGWEVAIGAAHLTRGWKAEDRVRSALDAAITWVAGCGGEPWVSKVPA